MASKKTPQDTRRRYPLYLEQKPGLREALERLAELEDRTLHWIIMDILEKRARPFMKEMD